MAAVKTFLTSLGLDRYFATFEDGEVDMGAIDVMEESDYAQLGVAKVIALLLLAVRECVLGLCFYECMCFGCLGL